MPSMKEGGAQLRFIRCTPIDAQQQIKILYSLVSDNGDTFPELQYLLQRLAAHPTMSVAWPELKHFDKVTPSELIFETFLVWAFTAGGVGKRLGTASGGGSTPLDVAIQARSVANHMSAFVRVEDITDSTLAELERAAAFLEREANHFKILLKLARAPRKVRAHTAHQVSFVNTMCDMLPKTKRRPYSLVAAVANAAFNLSPDDKEWTADRVRKCYHSRRNRIRDRNIK